MNKDKITELAERLHEELFGKRTTRMLNALIKCKEDGDASRELKAQDLLIIEKHLTEIQQQQLSPFLTNKQAVEKGQLLVLEFLNFDRKKYRTWMSTPNGTLFSNMTGYEYSRWAPQKFLKVIEQALAENEK